MVVVCCDVVTVGGGCCCDVVTVGGGYCCDIVTVGGCLLLRCSDSWWWLLL